MTMYILLVMALISFFVHFYWLFYLFTFEMLSPFSLSLQKTLYPISCPSASMQMLTYSPTHSCLIALAYPYLGSLSLHRVKGLPPIVPDKVILYYICSWSYGSLHVYSLVGGLVSGSSGVSGWLILSFFLWGCRPFHFLQSSPYVLHWDLHALSHALF